MRAPVSIELLARQPWEGFSDNVEWLAVRLEIHADGTGQAAVLRSVADVRAPEESEGVERGDFHRIARRWRIDRVTLHRRRIVIGMTSEEDGTVWRIHGKAIRAGRAQSPSLLLCFDEFYARARCHVVRFHPEARMSGRLRQLEDALATHGTSG